MGIGSLEGKGVIKIKNKNRNRLLLLARGITGTNHLSFNQLKPRQDSDDCPQGTGHQATKDSDSQMQGPGPLESGDGADGSEDPIWLECPGPPHKAQKKGPRGSNCFQETFVHPKIELRNIDGI